MQNRIIKFRAWDKATNRMLETGFHVLGEVTCFRIIEQRLMEMPEGKTTLERIGDVEIMQFTGLQDKQGNDVYEGDIILAHEHSTNYPLKHIVVFNEEELGFKLRWEGRRNEDGYYDEKLSERKYEVFEVIGNLFEHPHLLNQKTEQ